MDLSYWWTVVRLNDQVSNTDPWLDDAGIPSALTAAPALVTEEAAVARNYDKEHRVGRHLLGGSDVPVSPRTPRCYSRGSAERPGAKILALFATLYFFLQSLAVWGAVQRVTEPLLHGSEQEGLGGRS
jgi:hypothetical protein